MRQDKGLPQNAKAICGSPLQLKGAVRLFDRVARKFNADHAFHLATALNINKMLNKIQQNRTGSQLFEKFSVFSINCIHLAALVYVFRQAVFPDLLFGFLPLVTLINLILLFWT